MATIKELQDKLQGNITGLSNVLAPEARRVLQDFLKEILRTLSEHETAIADLRYRLGHPVEGPRGEKYPG